MADSERTVVRPTFSGLGSYSISDEALRDMVEIILRRVRGVASVIDFKVVKEVYGVVIDLELSLYYGFKAPSVLAEAQKRVSSQIEEYTSISVHGNQRQGQAGRVQCAQPEADCRRKGLHDMKRTRIYSMILIALFTTLTIIGTQITIPLALIPITLQTLFVLSAGMLLGSIKGMLSQLLYVALGLVGFPIFARGQGGPQMVFAISFGYLLGFIVAPLVGGAVLRAAGRVTPLSVLAAGLAGTVTIDIFGIAYILTLFKRHHGLADAGRPRLYGHSAANRSRRPDQGHRPGPDHPIPAPACSAARTCCRRGNDQSHGEMTIGTPLKQVLDFCGRGCKSLR